MSTGTHTPGPWIWGEDYRGLYGAGPENEVLVYEQYEGMWLGHGPSREANGHLIAAAPDLLAALRVAEESVGDLKSLEVVRAAIAKATGSAA